MKVEGPGISDEGLGLQVWRGLELQDSDLKRYARVSGELRENSTEV